MSLFRRAVFVEARNVSCAFLSSTRCRQKGQSRQRNAFSWGALSAAGVSLAAGLGLFERSPDEVLGELTAMRETPRIEIVEPTRDEQKEIEMEEGTTQAQAQAVGTSGTLPIFTLEEVRQHTCMDTGVWVTFEGGVYDVTSFLDAHPGGPNRILMVAGNDLQEYWKVYNLHHRRHIKDLLEKYRVGSLRPADVKRAQESSPFANTYIEDPKRNFVYDNQFKFRVPSERPWNAEPRKDLLVESFYTPNDIFWVRNHNPVPQIELEDWALEIEVEGKEDTVSLSFQDIVDKFDKVEIPATIQCAGNRQEEYVEYSEEWKEARPLWVAPHWRNGAIGNAKWGGVRVRDVLKHCGLEVDEIALGRKHCEQKWVSFIAEDHDETGTHYGGVIPIEKIIDPMGDAILAYEMNGVALPRDHGFPLRVIAPGHAGCRQVKWVSSILVSKQPSSLDSGSKLDRHFSPCVCFDDIRAGEQGLNLEQAPVIQTLPVQSIICNHYVDDLDESIVVKGVAWAGGGRGIARVDVSIDEGRTFLATDLYSEVPPTFNRNWTWVHFTGRVPFTEEIKTAIGQGKSIEVEIVSKAVDTDFNAQPERMEPYWNVLGICVNHWFREKIIVTPT